MKKRMGIAGMVLALAVGAQAAVTIDFTSASASGPFPGNSQTIYTYNDYDVFGDGSVTVDITVEDTASTATLNQREQGWGLNGGSGRLDAGESLTFTVSDLKGSAAAGVTGFEFAGFVAEVSNSAYTVTSDDIITVNGVTLHGRDQTNSTGLVDDLAWVGNAASQEGYDLEDAFTNDTSALTIGTSGSFVVAEVSNPSASNNFDSMRVMGFQINVLAAVNLPPVASPQGVTTFPDTAVEITLAGIDPEGSNLTYNVETQPAQGTLTGATNVWTYTPTNGYVGADSFTFTVNDGDTNSTPATVSISVTNEIPVANTQSVEADYETALPITLTGSDPDSGPDALTYEVTSLPSNGTLDTNSLPNVTYTPNATYSGPDSFEFKVNDGLADSAPATVSITVKEAGQPIAVGTVIGIDFGGDANPDPANWNLLAAPGATLSEVTDTNGTVLAGIDFTINDLPANDGENANSSISPNWPEIVDNAQNDAWFESNPGQWTLTFTGLDSNLTYNLTIGSYWTGGTAAQQENRNTGWQIGATQTNTIGGAVSGSEVSPAVDSAQSYVTFEDVVATNGTITISTWDYNANQISSLSALMLTATGQLAPDTPTINASVSGGSLIISWDSGGTFDVLTNENLVYPVWGVLESGATSPATNAVGSEAQLFYKLNYN